MQCNTQNVPEVLQVVYNKFNRSWCIQNYKCALMMFGLNRLVKLCCTGLSCTDDVWLIQVGEVVWHQPVVHWWCLAYTGWWSCVAPTCCALTMFGLWKLAKLDCVILVKTGLVTSVNKRHFQPKRVTFTSQLKPAYYQSCSKADLHQWWLKLHMCTSDVRSWERSRSSFPTDNGITRAHSSAQKWHCHQNSHPFIYRISSIQLPLMDLGTPAVEIPLSKFRTCLSSFYVQYVM